MPIGADTTLVNKTLRHHRADPRRVRREHDPRRLQRLVRHARPARARRGVPADGDDLRPDQRDHGRRARRRSSRRSRPRTCCSATTSGAPRWIAAFRARQRAGRPQRPAAGSSRRPDGRREARQAGPGLLPAGDPPRARPAGPPDRVRASASTPTGARPREVRVPAGVTLFDAASWNGIAIDSTCGGHGTCKKCRMRVRRGRRARCRGWTRAPSPPTSCAQGWRLACLRARPTQDLRVEVPPLVTRPKAATVGVGRQVILRPAVQKRLVELPEPTLADQRTDLERLLRRAGRPGAAGRPAGRPRPAAGAAATDDFRVTAVVVDDVLVDVEPRRHHRSAGSASRSTSVPPRSSPRCSTWPPARRSPSRRCSTRSSRYGARRDHAGSARR